jgi:serine/threonine-protein kinase
VGIILRSRDVDLGREVAMKVLRDELSEDAELLRRFVEEAQIAGQLQHPGIVPVYELGLRADGRPYFTMKLVKGSTLAVLLGARRDPLEDRTRMLSIFEAVCHTVAYAHARGVVHRDLKPSNVMVGAFGEVQVVDWGLAKVSVAAEPARGRRRPTTVRRTGDADCSRGVHHGTPRYMPPEQATGDVERVDERADVFALGGML